MCKNRTNYTLPNFYFFYKNLFRTCRCICYVKIKRVRCSFRSINHSYTSCCLKIDRSRNCLFFFGWGWEEGEARIKDKIATSGSIKTQSLIPKSSRWRYFNRSKQFQLKLLTKYLITSEIY